MTSERAELGWGGLRRFVLLIVLVAAGCGDSRPEPLVVYCAHDSLYADRVLQQFERETGIPLSIRYDTEATKSLGLTELLIREKDNPRCDVFWNNQLLGTAALKQHGILEPYKGPGYERIPAELKDPDGAYAGFAARLRVYIINTDNMPAAGDAVRALLDGDDLSRVAVAMPLYGTTLTHYTVLRDVLGEDGLRAMHADWRRRGVVERGGNATTKNLVAEGVCDLGWTDTDDFFVAKDAGKPVAMLPVRVGERDQVIAIPNTVAVIKGSDRPEAAQQLVDYLLSERVELELARSKSRQVPLGPVDDSQLPDEVRQLKQWAADPYPLSGLVEERAATLVWLKSEYLR